MPAALLHAMIGCGVVALGCWVLSLITREHSWVDRLWSLLPPSYVTWFASESAFSDPRLLVMMVLAWAWGARLTFNFARKGGYARGGEDYRWAEIRKRMSPAVFQLFGLVFIALFQNALLFLLAAPAWVALAHRSAPLGLLDAIATGLFLLFFAGEALADEQQWRFQRDKRARLERGEGAGPEFLTTGLFGYSRHPNFFCEQGIWCAFYLFAVAASGQWLQVWLAGPLLLIALFQGSTSFTEQLSRAKYPSYADYQRRVSRLWPLPPRER